MTLISSFILFITAFLAFLFADRAYHRECEKCKRRDWCIASVFGVAAMFACIAVFHFAR